MAALPVQSCHLFLPPLEEVAQVLRTGLGASFQEASVSVVQCPDLTRSPWMLAAPGLGGSSRLIDVGGVPYLIPVPNKSKQYNLAEVAELAELPGAFILGAGAGSSRVAGVNCEMMPNVLLRDRDGREANLTFIAKVSKSDGLIELERFGSVETGPLANVLASEGKAGEVLEIRVKGRTGKENFVTCMRNILAEKYGEQPVALGGVFNIIKGKVKLHVMPGFSEEPLESDEDVNNWLKFYDVSSPLTCLSVFISHDPGYDLRVEHTHCFSNHGEGGHYHYDITPDEVEYHGYYTLAQKLYRIDRPTESHDIGRD